MEIVNFLEAPTIFGGEEADAVISIEIKIRNLIIFDKIGKRRVAVAEEVVEIIHTQ